MKWWLWAWAFIVQGFCALMLVGGGASYQHRGEWGLADWAIAGSIFALLFLTTYAVYEIGKTE